MNTMIRRGFLAALCVVALVPFSAGAFQFKTGEQPSLPVGENIVDDVYMAGGSVSASSNVQGDLTITGGNILVSGPVQEDLNVGGGSITLLGDVGDDLRAGGGNIIVQGIVKGDVLVGGGQITLAGESIGGDVAVAVGSITITTPIAGDLKIAGGEVFINAPVAGSVTIHAESITFGEGAVVEGGLTYSSGKEATFLEGSRVLGEVVFTETTRPEHKNGAGVAAGIFAVLSVIFFFKLIASFVGALIIGYGLRRYALELVSSSMGEPWGNLGRGLVFIIVLPIVSILLMATLIGIPFGALGLLGFGAIMIFMSLVTPIVTGALVHKWIWKPAEYTVDWKTILLGVVVLAILGIIPFIGWIATCAIFLITVGAVWGIKWKALQEWR